jgi:lysophospholipase L1-like esterase
MHVPSRLPGLFWLFAFGIACCLEHVLSAATPVDLSRLPRVEARLKANETVTVVALGDSITTYFGNRSRNRGYYPVPLSVSYYGVFAEYLKKAYPQATLKLINEGIGGETANRGLKRVETVLSQNPDLVFVMYGANDGRAGREITQYISELKQIVSKIQAAGADVILVAPTMSLVDLAWLLPYRQAVLDLQGELECPVLDGTQALWPVDENVSTLEEAHQYLARHFPPDGDDIHPGINGHFQMGRRLWEQLIRPAAASPLRLEIRVTGPILLPGEVAVQLTLTNVSNKTVDGFVQVFFPKGMPVKDAISADGKLANKASGMRHYLPLTKLNLAPGKSQRLNWKLQLPDEEELYKTPSLFDYLKRRAGIGIAIFSSKRNDLFFLTPEYFPADIEVNGPRLVTGVDVELKLAVKNISDQGIKGELFPGKQSKKPVAVVAGEVAAFTSQVQVPETTDRSMRRVMPFALKGQSGDLLGLAVYNMEAVPMVDALKEGMVIDADLAEWKKGEWHSFAAGSATAEFAVRQHEQTLFLAVKAVDPHLSFERSGLWKGDGVELYFDSRAEAELGTPGTVFQLGFFPPKAPSKPLIVARGSGAGDFDTNTVQTAWRLTEDGYEMEVAIPISAFAKQGWAEGQMIGFSIACNNVEQQGEVRKQHHWAGDNGNYQSPVKLGLLRRGSGPRHWRILYEKR